MLKINIADIFVIGNSYNDISMFEVTKNSFIIKSKDNILNASATYVVNTIAECIDQIDY